jgi:tryptophan synthase alpha chain
VGFGISTPAHVKTVTKVADGVIIGSALINLLTEKGSRKMIDYVKSLVKEVAKK